MHEVTVRELHREARLFLWLEHSLQDIRFAIRSFLKSKGFVAVAILTLALGIGASTAVFSIVNAILLKALPYPDAERIVVLWRAYPIDPVFGGTSFPWTLRELRLLLDHDPATFEAVGAFKSDSFNLTGAGEPTRLDGIRASAGFFPVLGVKPVVGRVFRPQESEARREHVVILSYKLWSERFGADPGVPGRTMALNGSVYTVVGVMPPGFAFPRGDEIQGLLDLPHEAQLWVPLPIPAVARGPNEYGAIGRLKPGFALAQGQAELKVVDKRIEAQLPGEKGAYNRVVALARQVTGDTRLPLLLILGAVGVVLLIACSNVASLLLTRALGRAGEFALRSALGAGRGRLIRQLLTESLLLAAAGGCAGILVAQGAIHFAKVFGPSGIPRLWEAGLDSRVFFFAACITLVSGVVFGLAPAAGSARRMLSESLKQGPRSGGGAGAP